MTQQLSYKKVKSRVQIVYYQPHQAEGTTIYSFKVSGPQIIDKMLVSKPSNERPRLSNRDHATSSKEGAWSALLHS